MLRVASVSAVLASHTCGASALRTRFASCVSVDVAACDAGDTSGDDAGNADDNDDAANDVNDAGVENGLGASDAAAWSTSDQSLSPLNSNTCNIHARTTL